jgi:hypothetical protein
MKKIYSVTIALGVSLFIYAFYRSEKTLVNSLIIMVLSLETYAGLKDLIVSAMPLDELIIFSLPGGLWVFCATAVSQGFYVRAWNRKLQVAIVPVLFAIGLEFCQLVHITQGRFDVLDVAFYLFFWSLATYIFESYDNQQKVLSPFTLPGFICLACLLSVYLAHVQQ